MKRRWLVCSMVLLSLVLALPASTQTHSVLTNGGFEVDTSGWSAWTGTLARTTTTVHSGDGAAQVTLDGQYGQVDQCIDLSPYLATWPGDPKYLTFSGYLHSDGTVQVYLFSALFGNTDCTGTFYGNNHTSRTTAASWQLHTITAEIPAGAQSVTVKFIGDNIGGGTFYADDLAAFSSTATAVETRGMAARNSLWAVGLVGVAAVGVVLGRRKKS